MKICRNCGVAEDSGKIIIKGLCPKCRSRWRRHHSFTVTKRMNEGREKHPLYNLYGKIKQRCYNQRNEKYRYYGGRGIKMCDRWLGIDGFWHFVEDMGERPEGTSLDRIDVNGNYCPENCRWATPHMQSNNRRVCKGFYLDETTGLWRVTMKHQGKRIVDARFHTDYGAIIAHRMAERLYGLNSV